MKSLELLQFIEILHPGDINHRIEDHILNIQVSYKNTSSFIRKYSSTVVKKLRKFNAE